MKSVDGFSLHFPSLRKVGSLLTGGVGSKKAAEEELADPFGVGVGREARIELRRSRLDGDDEGGIGRGGGGASDGKEKRKRMRGKK
ncbi:MAG: hypothetical protein MPW15_25200 [Candidatus Manganitrophus sp.]|nr:hypothetical protein [Candidatus Manganitrophus sp.]